MVTNQKNRTQKNNRSFKTPADEFDQVIIDIARVTRVMAGGKRMRFRACVVVGNKKGKVGSAVAKGADVPLAVNKAVAKAKKHVISVPIVRETVPHRVDCKFGAAKILLKPAPKGTGVIAGGAVRVVLEFAGISNVVAKSLGSKNKINNVGATMKALQQLKKVKVKEQQNTKTQKNQNTKTSKQEKVKK